MAVSMQPLREAVITAPAKASAPRFAYAPKLMIKAPAKSSTPWAWVAGAFGALALLQSRGLIAIGGASPLAILGVGAAATAATAATASITKRDRVSLTARVPLPVRPIVESGLAAAAVGLAEASAEATEYARSFSTAQLATLARTAINYGPLSATDPSPHVQELVALAKGPDTLDARVRVMSIGMGGVEHGVGIVHNPGRDDLGITDQNVKDAASAAVAVCSWWTSSATYWRPERPRLWSGDVLGWALRFVTRPACAGFTFEGDTIDERNAVLGRDSCHTERSRYLGWLQAAIDDWAKAAGLSAPTDKAWLWRTEIPRRGTPADQLALVAALAPAMNRIALAKVTIWYTEVPSYQWGTGEIVAAVIGGIIGAVALGGAAAGVWAVVGGAAVGGAAGAAGSGAVAGGTAAAVGGASVGGVATGAAGAAVGAAGAFLGLSPTMTAGLVAIGSAAAGAVIDAALD